MNLHPGSSQSSVIHYLSTRCPQIAFCLFYLFCFPFFSSCSLITLAAGAFMSPRVFNFVSSASVHVCLIRATIFFWDNINCAVTITSSPRPTSFFFFFLKSEDAAFHPPQSTVFLHLNFPCCRSSSSTSGLKSSPSSLSSPLPPAATLLKCCDVFVYSTTPPLMPPQYFGCASLHLLRVLAPFCHYTEASVSACLPVANKATPLFVGASI